MVMRSKAVVTSDTARDRISMLYDFLRSFLFSTKTRITRVFPIIATIDRMEYVKRVKLVIPSRGWLDDGVDELETFILVFWIRVPRSTILVLCKFNQFVLTFQSIWVI